MDLGSNFSVNVESVNVTNATIETISNYKFFERIFLEIYTVISITCLVANFLLAFAIAKYKKLWREVTNKILFFICAMEFLYMLSTPLTLRMFQDFDLHLKIGMTVTCIVDEMEIIYLFCILLLLMVILVDWYLKAYNDVKYQKFCKIYKITLAMVFAFGIFMLAISIQICAHYGYNVIGLFTVFLVCVINAVFVTVINIIHEVKRRRAIPYSSNTNNLGLAIANIFLLTLCPGIVLVALEYVMDVNEIIWILAVSFAFTSPIFNFIYLYYCNNDYRVFLRAVLKCQCFGYNSEELDEHPISYSDAAGVQITAT